MPLRMAVPAAFLPLRHKRYRDFWLSNICTNFGIWIQTVAATWLMISLTPRSDMVAMIQTAMTLPAIISCLLGGILSDLWTRRVVLMAGQMIVIGGTAMLAILQGFENLTPWLLLGFTFMVGAGTHMNLPAMQASASDLVPYDDIPHAIALNAIGYNMARSLGPAIGGSLVAIYGVATAFAVSAVLHLMLLITLLRSKMGSKGREFPPEPFFPAIAAGFRYARRAPSAIASMARCAVFTFCAAAVWALLPLLAERENSGSPLLYGMLLACLSIGAVAGALLFNSLRKKLGGEALLNTGSGVLAVSLLLLAVPSSWLPLLLALFAAGVVWVTNLTILNITVQLSVAEWVRTRILALYYIAMAGGMAAGSWFWGVITQSFGLEVALLGAAGVTVCSLLLAFLLPIPDQLPNDLAPIENTLPVDLPTGIDPARDPVVIQVEYQIDPSQTVAFQQAIDQLRIIRLRDGAYRWALYQSIAEPNTWIESFLLDSWTEYLRRRRQLTQRDWKTIKAVRQFHTGPDRPRVSRFIQRQP